MRFYLNKGILLSFSMIFSASTLAVNMQCENKDFTLQTLGSGGPISDDQRASSGEIIWLNGKSALLIDAGGGVFSVLGRLGHDWKI